MRIFCNGCSWTTGAELKDPEKSRYSTLLGQMLGAEVTNISKIGTSLHRLLRSTYERCDPTKYDIAVLQFTFPARTEYYVPGMSGNRQGSFMRTLPYVTSATNMDHVRKDLNNEQEHLNYQKSYYKTAYTIEMSQTFEFMVFQALQDHFARYDIPLVTMTLNNESVLPFDLRINTSDIPREKDEHPNELGHRIIAKKIKSVIEFGNGYPDAKRPHLQRLNRDHEKLYKENHHTDYN